MINTEIVFAASAARTESGQSSGDSILPQAFLYSQGTVVLDVTVDESTANDKLDVFIQRKLPGGIWDTIARFTQHDGNAAAQRYVLDIYNDGNVTPGARLTDDVVGTPVLAEATVRGVPFCSALRIAGVVTDDSDAASYTFEVRGQFTGR
jgi:hypothetical protein